MNSYAHVVGRKQFTLWAIMKFVLYVIGKMIQCSRENLIVQEGQIR